MQDTRSLNFHGLVSNAPMARARGIPDSHFHSVTLTGGVGQFVAFGLFATGQFGGYVVHVDQTKKTIVHDCPDWKERQAPTRRFCKHVAKFFMLLPLEVANALLDDIARDRTWQFISSQRTVARVRAQTQEDVFLRLLEEGKIREAVGTLMSAAAATSAKAAFEERTTRALLTAAQHLSPGEALQFATEVVALRPPPVVFLGFYHALLTGLESIAAQSDVITALTDAAAIETVLKYAGQALSAQVLDAARRQFAQASEPVPRIALACLLLGMTPSLKIQNLFPDERELSAGSTLISRRLETAMIHFAEETDVQLLSEALKRLGASSQSLESRLQRYREELEQIRIDAFTRKVRWLLRLVRDKRVMMRLSFSHVTEESGSPLVWLRVGRLAALERFVLDACGLEGKHNYIFASDFVQHYPVLSALSNGDIPFLRDAWEAEAQRVKREVVERWGSLNPRIAPALPRESAVTDEQRAPLYPDQIIVEWTTSASLIRGTYLKAVREGATYVPLPTARLSAELEPFDLTLCSREPVEVRGNVRLLAPRRRITLAEAIHAIERSTPVISRYRPLHVLDRALHDEEISLSEIDYGIQACEDFAFIEDLSPLQAALRRARETVVRRQREKKFAYLKTAEDPPSDDELRELMLTDGLDTAANFAPAVITTMLVREAFNACDTLNDALNFLVNRVAEPLLALVAIESPLRPFPVEAIAQTRLRFLVPAVIQKRLDALRQIVPVCKKGKYDAQPLKRTVYGQAILKQLKLDKRRYLTAEEWERVAALRAKVLEGSKQ